MQSTTMQPMPMENRRNRDNLYENLERLEGHADPLSAARGFFNAFRFSLAIYAVVALVAVIWRAVAR